MSIDRPTHLTSRNLTSSKSGLSDGSGDLHRCKETPVRERRAPSQRAVQNFADVLHGAPNASAHESEADTGQPFTHPHGKEKEKGDDMHQEKPEQRAPLPDVFSLIAASAAAPMQRHEQLTKQVTSSVPSSDAEAAAIASMAAASLLARPPVAGPLTSVAPLHIDALRVGANGSRFIEMDVGTETASLSGLTIRLSEQDGRLQVDLQARSTALFERMASQAEPIAQKLHTQLRRAVLVRVEQVEGGRASAVASLAS